MRKCKPYLADGGGLVAGFGFALCGCGFGCIESGLGAAVGASKKSASCGWRYLYRGTSLIRNTHPPRITIGP